MDTLSLETMDSAVGSGIVLSKQDKSTIVSEFDFVLTQASDTGIGFLVRI